MQLKSIIKNNKQIFKFMNQQLISKNKIKLKKIQYKFKNQNIKL